MVCQVTGEKKNQVFFPQKVTILKEIIILNTPFIENLSKLKKVIYPLEHNSKNFLFGILKFIHSTSYISLTIVHEIIHTFLLFFFFF